MMKQKISIIVPVYNAENYLEQCILSILNQTYTNIELVLVNDGSKDSSDDICRRYSSRTNVVYLSKINGGASSARNLGLKNASGDFVIFVDADDFIDKSMISDLYKSIISNDSQVACCGFKKYYDDEHIVNYSTINVDNKDPYQVRNMIFNELIGGRGCGSPVCKLYDLKIIRDNNILFDESISNNEDVLFNLSYFKLISKASFEKIFPYNYRKGQLSLSSGYINHWLELSKTIIKAKKEILGKELCVTNEKLISHAWVLINIVGIINELLCSNKSISKDIRKNNFYIYVDNIKSVSHLRDIVYNSYDYPDRRSNFRRIYPLIVFLPSFIIKFLGILLIRFK